MEDVGTTQHLGQLGQLGQQGQPSLVAEGLKCPVCWDYFEKPHTLCCGHTFCLRCLQNLARITRSSKTRTPLDRLRMCCPACRKKTLVRPILKRRASLNYAIKQFMNDWFDSPLSNGQIYYIKLKSVGSQTDNSEENSIPEVSSRVKEKLKELEDEANDVSAEEEREVVLYKIDSTCKSKETLLEQTVEAEDILSTDADDIISASDDNQASSSGDESEPDLQIGPMFENNDMAARRHRIGLFGITSVSAVLGILFLELSLVYRGIRQSRSRTILTILWFIYGSIIVFMSKAFLPWMTFYTAIYFIIIYVEVAPGRLFR